MPSPELRPQTHHVRWLSPRTVNLSFLVAAARGRLDETAYTNVPTRPFDKNEQ